MGRQRCSVLTFLAGLFVCAPMGVAAEEVVDAQAKLDAALEKWEALGGKTSFSELQLPAIPDEENAAIAYERAFALLSQLSDEEATALDPEEPDERKKPVIEKMRPAIELALQAADMNQCRWKIDYSGPLEVDMPHLQAMVLRKLLIATIVIAANEGRGDEAVALIRAKLALDRAICKGPLVISQLVGRVGDSGTYWVIERVAPLLNADDLKALATVLSAQTDLWQESFCDALLAEGAKGLSLFADPRWNSPNPVWDQAADKLYFLSEVTRFVELASKPYCEIKDELEMADPPKYAIGSKVLLASYDKSIKACAETQMMRRLTTTAIAVRLHKLEHGDLPEEWNTPTDPLTGLPLGYERTETGFRLWSPAIEGETDPKKRAQLEWRWDE